MTKRKGVTKRKGAGNARKAKRVAQLDKRVVMNLRLPKQTVLFLVDVAALSGTTIDQTTNVLLSAGVVACRPQIKRKARS